ncbi:hypothetical protein [Thermococcus sp.]|nr:hypothetical protein [Thermococcus sp.]
MPNVRFRIQPVVEGFSNPLKLEELFGIISLLQELEVAEIL